jgi:hypothetical protein
VAAGVRRQQQQRKAKIKKDKEEKWRTCNLHVTWSGPIYLLFFFFSSSSYIFSRDRIKLRDSYTDERDKM